MNLFIILTEAELLSLIKQKDKTAFNYLYDNYSWALFDQTNTRLLCNKKFLAASCNKEFDFIKTWFFISALKLNQ
ncbi:MAG: hypothetical protein IPI50_00950 [Saprospiraceae bacterium]|nr:hypothetical protein [Saprospiraceae bacterium]